MKATDELVMEHRGIEIMLRILKAISQRLQRGGKIESEHLDGILEFLTIFIDKCHHGKEEEFLFPALEAAGVIREGGPIGVLLSEHEKGRKLVTRLKDALKDYAGGDEKSSDDVARIIEDYVALLTQHIIKENSVLFPMVESKLNSQKDTELYQAFEQLELERIGPGRHEEFHGFLVRLQRAYLVNTQK